MDQLFYLDNEEVSDFVYRLIEYALLREESTKRQAAVRNLRTIYRELRESRYRFRQNSEGEHGSLLVIRGLGAVAAHLCR